MSRIVPDGNRTVKFYERHRSIFANWLTNMNNKGFLSRRRKGFHPNQLGFFVVTPQML